jgi:hypothetical protein
MSVHEQQTNTERREFSPIEDAIDRRTIVGALQAASLCPFEPHPVVVAAARYVRRI